MSTEAARETRPRLTAPVRLCKAISRTGKTEKKVANAGKKNFELENLRLGILIADQAASIIDKAGLYERLGEAVKGLQNMNQIKLRICLSFLISYLHKSELIMN